MVKIYRSRPTLQQIVYFPSLNHRRTAMFDDQPLPLTCFGCKSCVKLCFLAVAPDEAQRLRELGVREGNSVEVVRNADTFVCRVEASRIALRREVAMNVFATPVAA